MSKNRPTTASAGQKPGRKWLAGRVTRNSQPVEGCPGTRNLLWSNDDGPECRRCPGWNFRVVEKQVGKRWPARASGGGCFRPHFVGEFSVRNDARIFPSFCTPFSGRSKAR